MLVGLAKGNGVSIYPEDDGRVIHCPELIWKDRTEVE